MNDILRFARLKIALQRAFLGRAILRVIIQVFADTYLGGLGLSCERIRVQGPISGTLSCKAEYYLARQQSTTDLRSSR